MNKSQDKWLQLP